MNSFFEALMDGSVIKVIGWTLLHFVWQAAAIGIVVFGLLLITRKHTAATRYWICCTGLLAMVACPVVSLLYFGTTESLASNFSDPIASQSNVAATTPESAANTSTWEYASATDQSIQISTSSVVELPTQHERSVMSQIEDGLSNWLPFWVALWIFGVSVHFARLAAGIWRVNHWVSHASPVKDAGLVDVFTRLCHRTNLNLNVRLLLCDKTKTPAVAGIFRPAVLIPTSLLTGLSFREIELVLAHELAHVKRHDFLINILQKTAESLLFYHPAVWWISNRISVERENCCDDLAVEVCGDRIALAKALTAMESVRCADESLAPAATGGVLAHRIRRLLMLEPQPVQSAWPVGLIGILLAGIFLSLVPSLSSKADAMTSSTIESVVDTAPETEVATQTAEPKRDETEKKPESKKLDSRTQIEQRVFTNISLNTEKDNEIKESTLDMKYSNVIPYSFIPARTAKALNAVKLGELDFTGFRDGHQLTNVTWLIVPNDFANPMGYIKDGVSHRFLHYLHKPTDNPIVPYREDQLFAPDHLGFYGMNKTKQMKFDVVRIREVDLGIGKPFGPVNALVSNDENSDFGLLGNMWARQVRGKNGGTLVHSAVGEFRIYPPNQTAPENAADPRNPRLDVSGNNLKLKQNYPDIQFSVAADQSKEVNSADTSKLPQFEVIEKDGSIKHIAVNSINVRRSAVDLLKHFESTLDRYGPQRGISITNMESIVSANPTKRFHNLVEANEIIFSLPEGSKSRAAIIGDVVEMNTGDDSVEITVTNGKVQWIDSVGVVRATASPGWRGRTTCHFGQHQQRRDCLENEDPEN